MEQLIDAAIKGNEQYLENIDKLILHRIAARNFITTPLHVASSLGHVNFVKKLLDHSPDLAVVLDKKRRSSLHLAAEKGHKEVVTVLLEHGKDMCLAVDDEGRNPLHVAAMKGKVDVLEAMIVAVGPDVAQARVRNGLSILHLCVLHRQRQTLKVLMKLDCQKLINAVDDGGDTILHLAVADKNVENFKRSLERVGIEDQRDLCPNHYKN